VRALGGLNPNSHDKFKMTTVAACRLEYTGQTCLGRIPKRKV
jgi:hypothetical protein